MSDDFTVRQEAAWSGPGSEQPGSRIGPFLLVRRIGEGGFGVVFEAEQQQPVKRRVALKILKLGMDTREVISRFDAERQALAMMEHPNIARVLDAGATEGGRPYFVMEYVEGVPISQYCDEHQLEIVDRLRLFEQVCAAVQHAHSKGVIHRDIKPGNVLVATQDGKPLTKVIDFGIAKATSGNLGDRTLATELNQVIGTPQYMSPEQAAGSADIDTRADVYALGVMLYELLSGSTPIDVASLRAAAFAEVQRLICEVEPPRPSARLASDSVSATRIAARRGTDPRRLARDLRGELDWIVMKAIEKDRARRYETANGLAMDVHRHLASEPVLAAPPSASYRLQKFVRRNKGAVAAGSAIAVALLVGIFAFAWQARIARARADELQQVSTFQASMLENLDPSQAGRLLDEDVRARYVARLVEDRIPEPARSAQVAAFDAQWRRVNATDVAVAQIEGSILRPAASAIDAQFSTQPLVQAALRQSLANVYVTLGEYDQALPLLQGVLSTRVRLLGRSDPRTLDSLSHLGILRIYQGRFDLAEPLLKQLLSDRERVLGAKDPETLGTVSDLGELYRQMDKLDLAEKYARIALAGRRIVLGNDAKETLDSISNLGLLLDDAGRLDEAEPFELEAMQRSRRVLGPDSPDTLTSIDNYGALKIAQGDLEQADRYVSEAAAGRRRVLGESHPDTLTSINNLAVVKAQEGKDAEAETYYRQAYEMTRRQLGEDHPDSLRLGSSLGELLLRHGDYANAEPMLRESLERSRRVLGADHSSTLKVIGNLASLLVARHDYASAARLLGDSEATARRVFSGDRLRFLPALLTTLGRARAGLHEFADAERILLEARNLLVRTRAARHGDAADNLKALISLYAEWDGAEPGQGHAASRAQWQKAYDDLAAQ